MTNEVVWLPAAVAQLVCQTLILSHGLGSASVLLMLLVVALRSHASGSLGLVTLALRVDGMAFLSVITWAMVWSITESRSRL